VNELTNGSQVKISMSELSGIFDRVRDEQVVRATNLADEEMVVAVVDDGVEIPIGDLINISLVSDVSDRSYVGDGLALFYDAWNNTGDGHDDEATTWKNLAPTGEIYDGVMRNFDGGHWSETSLSFDGVDDFVATDVKQSTFGNNITVQATASVDEAVKFRAIGGGHSDIPGLAFGQWQPAGFSFGVYNKGVFVSYPHSEIVLGTDYNMAMSVADGTEIRAYIDSKSQKTGQTAWFESLSDEMLKIGWAFPKRADGERFHLGTVSTFLVYDRALSAAEIDWNYQLDKVRYGFNQFVDQTTTYRDPSGEAYIPSGYKIVSDQSTGDIVSIDGGLVVEDRSGEQFVWVPVPDIETMIVDDRWGRLYATFDDPSFNADLAAQEYKSGEGLREPDGTKFDSDKPLARTVLASVEQFFYKMVDSVKKYGGFYVSRREVEVKGASDWFMAYATASEFGQDSTISGMIMGCQWDQIMNWFVNSGVDVKDSTQYGYYSNSNKPVRVDSDETKVLNIYDLAGYHWEWTTESAGDSYRVMRGGEIYNDGAGVPVSARLFATPDEVNMAITTTRAVLIIAD
jgi:hypothetical protein